MTAGNPGRAQFSPAWVNPPECGVAFDEGGRYGRATFRCLFRLSSLFLIGLFSIFAYH
ncbi:hypothetical protein BD01_0594 [Thermococcus nautili]|uniref:Uncharacterized protein n=1 Tax=Thermococcus nautili TaxID=195522 RepID=W8NSM4_9EURY|nr:hypothetical protein BD01_0594 [Thermococcus nautili]